MARFIYSAVDKTGSVVTGNVTAPDDLAAMDQLTRKGLTPISLNENGAEEGWWQRDIVIFGDSKKLKLRDQLHFFTTVETMLASGFSVMHALTLAQKQARDARSKRVLNAVVDYVNAGGTLADALDETQGFQPRLIGLVRVAERSNRLKEVFAGIAETLSGDLDNARQVRQALIYPIILLLMSVLVIFMLVFFLAPTLAPVFRSAGVPPPVVINTLDGAGRFLQAQWLNVLITLGATTLALTIFRMQITSLLIFFMTKLPGIRTYFSTLETLRFMKTLRLMLGSGAQLAQALDAAIETTISARWRHGIIEIRKRLEAGDTLSAALRESCLTDDSALAFVEAGEEGNQMTPMLDQAVRSLDKRIREQITQALRLVTPILTLMIGGTVGLLIFSTIGAIMDLNDLAVQ